MNNSFFKTLTKEEEIPFRQWARENYNPGNEVKSIWHPSVRDECLRMNQEAEELEDHKIWLKE